MSKQEQIKCRIEENIQKIEFLNFNLLFETATNSKIIINHLRKENIRLEELLTKLREKKKKIGILV